MVGSNDKVERMVVQGGEKIGKNQRKIGDTGCNPDITHLDLLAMDHWDAIPFNTAESHENVNVA